MATDFHGEFLRELAALDDYLARREGERFVEPEDPDVRRLMESLAFFSARTRDAAAAELRSAVQRLTQGLLDDFVHPQPARAMLRAIPSPRLTEPAVLPRGTRVRVETLDGEVGQFSTMHELKVRPLELDRAELQLRGAGVRVLIRLRAYGPVVHVGEPLAMHIDHLGDYDASCQLHHHLAKHLQRVGVVYGDSPAPSELGQACEFRFGAAQVGDAGFADELRSQQRTGVISRIREFFHFPGKDLSLAVELARPARPWRQAWLCLDLDEWPEHGVVNKEMFRLFMVPIENLFSELAEPIKCDGTRARHPIVAWRTEGDVAFHSVLEVEQELATGMDVILPGHIASGEESWDLDYDDEHRPELILRLPGAFVDPRMVMVRARWYQPNFDALALGKLEATLHGRHVEGVGFRVQGGLVPHRVSPLSREPTAMLHVLSRRSKRLLSREDIIMLMSVLGADAHGFHDVASELRRVEVTDEPAGVRGNGGIRHVYRVRLADVPEARRGRVDDYLRCVELLLDAWSSNPVTIRIDEPTPRKRPEIVRSAS
ncbi:type VI secretion system baseplate subunit TssF [Nannocystaceae bacterium ST9]